MHAAVKVKVKVKVKVWMSSSIAGG